MKLGIIYKDNQIINHQSLLKVLLNPFLRRVGVFIGTKYESGKLKGIILNRCVKTPNIIWSFKYDVKYDYIIKKRVII